MCERETSRGRSLSSGEKEEGLLAWPGGLSWTSKPRVCSKDVGLSFPQIDRQMSL